MYGYVCVCTYVAATHMSNAGFACLNTYIVYHWIYTPLLKITFNMCVDVQLYLLKKDSFQFPPGRRRARGTESLENVQQMSCKQTQNE